MSTAVATAHRGTPAAVLWDLQDVVLMHRKARAIARMVPTYILLVTPTAKGLHSLGDFDPTRLGACLAALAQTTRLSPRRGGLRLRAGDLPSLLRKANGWAHARLVQRLDNAAGWLHPLLPGAHLLVADQVRCSPSVCMKPYDTSLRMRPCTLCLRKCGRLLSREATQPRVVEANGYCWGRNCRAW